MNKKIAMLVLLVVLVYVALAALPITLRLGWQLVQQPALLFGLVVIIVLYFKILRTRFRVFQTLDHELSHAMISLMFGHRVTELFATNGQGGHIHHVGRRHNFLIHLAPYIWRIPLILVTFVIWLLNRDKPEWYLMLVYGMALGYNIISIYVEARPHQPDLKRVGLWQSYLIIVCVNIIWLGVVFTAMINNYGIENYVKSIFDRSKDIVDILIG